MVRATVWIGALGLVSVACSDGQGPSDVDGGDAEARLSNAGGDAGPDGSDDAALSPVDGAMGDSGQPDGRIYWLDAGLEAEGLCEFPPFPPRLPAVNVGEKACSTTSAPWPDCIPDACDAPDFEAACRQYCEMTCERERWFCTGHHCPTTAGGSYCGSDEARQECEDLCGSDPECLRAACGQAREVSCGALSCPPGRQSACADLSCSNACATALNGQCEDGSPINASASTCELGTDCADCGARAACFGLGEECFSNSQCCGFDTGDVWCVNVGTADEPLGRCVPDCSPPAALCPDDFECRQIDRPATAACFPDCSP